LNPFDNYTIADAFFIEDDAALNKRYPVFQAIDNRTGKKVAMKKVRSAGGVLNEVSKLSHEYSILKRLDNPHIPKVYELISSGKMVTLVMDWIEAESLKEVIRKGPIPLSLFFDYTIRIVEALQSMHNAGVIHRDVNPSNILISKEGEVKLVDFGISTTIHSEENEKLNLDLIEGTLVYMAPEQTGRTSYAVTDASDLYALGISMYEMLVGKPPFDSVDPLEIIHFHLSRKPIPLQKVNPKLPYGICLVIEKLIEKNPDDRYQSEEALLADLHYLKDCFVKGKKTDDFRINTKQSLKRYKEPQKLYGREEQINQLLKTFGDLEKSKSSLVLLSGYAGIGKSVLVKQVQQPIIEKRAIFISGKFDQFKRNIPYFSFIEAFNDLISSLLSESEEKIEFWRKRLSLVLGENGGLITEVIPYLEKVIGKQPPIPKLQPAESEFRFRGVMLDFIYAFSSPGSPLVIFLDDLQWADLPSLNLIERILVTSGNDKVLIIGTYRDNEVNEMHPLAMTIQQLKSNGIALNEIKLKELDEKTTIQLVADSFGMSAADAKELGQITYSKTGGNPFFINRFLKSLYVDNHVVYNSSGQWQWEKSTIEGLAYADNVVDLMSREMVSLPMLTREVIKSAAVLGNTFNLSQLSLILDKSQHEIFKILMPALEAGYLIPIDTNYRNLSLNSAGLGGEWKDESDKLVSSFKFMHDRVQQAAYSLIPESERDKVHLQTGRILLANTLPEDLSDAAFNIIGHFANSLYLITDKEEKKRLAKLFLLAGQKAKDSTSYDLSVIHLTNALNLNTDFGWKAEYQLTYDIYIALGESEFLNNNHDKALHYFDELLKYARTNLEKLEIYYVQSSLYLKLSRTSESIALGRKAMRLFDINFPERPLEIKIKALILMIRYFVNFSKNSRRAQELMLEEECKIPQEIEINKFLIDMQSCAYQENQDLMLVLVFKSVERFLKHGYTDSSAFAFSSFGVVTLSVLGLSKKGFSLWDLVAELSPRTKSDFMKGKIDYIQDGFSSHWRRPVGENLDRILETIKKCTINGDPHFTGYAITNYISKKMAAGYPVQDVLDWSIDKIEYLKRNKHFSGLDFSAPKVQLLKALAGKTPYFGDWDDSSFSGRSFLESIHERGNQSALGHYYCTRVTLLFYFEKYREAIETSDEGRPSYPFIVGQWLVPEWEFFSAMSIAGNFAKFSKTEKRKRGREFKKSLKLMKKWAKHCPENFNPFLFLMQAELSAIEGHFRKTIELYEKSIKASSDSGFIQIEAIANKRAALFLHEQGHTKIARTFLKSSFDLFYQWGATALCKDLENKYPSLLGLGANEHYEGTELHVHKTGSTASISLDLGTILKASQSLAREVKLHELLLNLMYIVIENAGAERGCLLLERDGKLCVEAEGNSGPKGNRILASVPFTGSNLVPESLINYCWRVEGDVVVSNAMADEKFKNDEYVKANNVLSMLCIPISEKGVKIGLLYLENKLLEGVFTRSRLELLNLISGQIGISIQNALLYENLEEKVAERTLEISKQQLKIEAEMKKSDALLLNILPEQTARDLKTKGYSDAISYPNVNVMFCDIVGFTARVEHMGAKELVAEIHELFTEMDDIMKKYKIEKIKTIGDAYMCASGLTKSTEESEISAAAMRMIEAAKEVLECVERLNAKKVASGKEPLRLRIGIHSGPVIAGVVGKSKFAYDIWGDAVNTAARMESAGVEGKINISYDTYQRIKNDYSCVSRGKIEAKNKGLIEMFFVD
jgi:histidine kinase